MRLALLILLSCLCASAQPTDELARKSELAKSYMATNRFLEAAGVYGELVKAIPGNAGLLLNQGMALHLAGQEAGAIPVLESALKLNPSIPPAQLFLGASYLRTQQPSKALAPLKKFVASNPNHLEARQMLVDASTLLGKPAEAIPHLEKLSELQPSRPGVWYELGRAYEGVASDDFARMEKLYPESGPWFALIGDSRSKASQSRAAFFFYRKALEKDRRLRGVHREIAAIYRTAGHAEWAAAEDAEEKGLGQPDCGVKTAECEFLAGRARQALRLARAGQTVTAYYWRVRAASQLAKEAFARLLALPASPESCRFEAETARDQGKHADAVARWRDALRLAPGHPDFSRELAASLVQARQYEEAQKTLAPLLRSEPAAPELNHLQGDLLLAQQLPEQAAPFLEKAVRGDGANLAARAQLARALLAMGKPAEALPHANAALPLDTDGSLQFQLARAYQAAGRSAEAKAAMARYQEIQARSKEQDRVLEEEVQITGPGK